MFDATLENFTGGAIAGSTGAQLARHSVGRTPHNMCYSPTDTGTAYPARDIPPSLRKIVENNKIRARWLAS